MNAQEILKSHRFRKCLDFHGHICPGLSIGYKAACVGLERLKEGRSEDEELVAVVETDACCADAIQVMTGCTFGKGNFIHKDHGKMVFTFFSRRSGKGIRVSLKPGAFVTDEEHSGLLQKVMAGTANNSETKRFRELHRSCSLDVLEKPSEQLFAIVTVQEEPPEKAKIDPSIVCNSCGEPTMASKMVESRGKKVCRECFEKDFKQ